MEHFFTGTGQYVASAELMSAVNVAITLEKPLLIKGEPGTGKTLLAQAAGGVAPERIAREIPFAGVLVKKDKDLRTLRKALG